MNLIGFAKRAEKLIVDNSPSILTAIGVTGAITTAVLTGRASFKAADILAREAEDLEPKEKVKLVWSLYIPAVTTGALTIASIIGANRIGTRRAAAIAAAYSLSERAFVEYKEKVVERIGQPKEQALRDDLAQDRIDRDPISSKQVIITGTGTVLCYDSITGRYFESDMETLRKAQNDLNQRILNQQYAPLSDFFEMIGLPPTPYSSEIGWNMSDLCELKFSTCLSEDGRPCISLEYAPFPIRDYY